LNPASRGAITEAPVEERESGAQNGSARMDPIDTQHSPLSSLRMFWGHRRLLSRAWMYSLIASVLLAFLIPSRYQSTTRLMPPESQSAGLGLLAAMAGRTGLPLAELGGDLLGVKSSGALFVGIVGSQTVRDSLINEFELMKEYHDSKIEDARRDLADRTDASEDRKTGIITIAVTDHDPKQASAMALAYVKQLDRLVAQVTTSSARRERIFLEGRLLKVRGDLDTAARQFSDFASKNTAVDIGAQEKGMFEAAARLQGQIIAGDEELSGLRLIYTDSNVRVRGAEARITSLKKKLNEMIGGRPAQGDSPSDGPYPSIRKLPVLGVRYADLYRQTRIEETVYEMLTQQYELAKVQEAKEIPTVKVLDPAIVPTKKSFPPRAVITILGSLFGLVLTMTWIAGKARWDEVDNSDPRKEFAVEVYTTLRASLPKFASRNGAVGSSGGRSAEIPSPTREIRDGTGDDGGSRINA